MQMHLGEEQLLAIKRHTVRHANVTHVAARTCGLNRLHHRLLRANTLQDRISANAIVQFLDSRNAFITALGHDIRGAKFACELLPRLMTAHRDDPLGTHLLCG